MLFKRNVVLNWYPGTDSAEVQLDIDSSSRHWLVFALATTDRDKRHGRHVCTLFVELAPPASVQAFLEQWDGQTSADVPEAVYAFSSEFCRQTHEALVRAIHLIRWVRGSSRSHNPIAAWGQAAFLRKKDRWLSLPAKLGATIQVLIGERNLDTEVATSVADLWRSGAQEPLAHELFREACSNEDRNPRSSLVLAVAAAEVGFKQLVGRLVPDARWLVENLPSPPLGKMLRHYLPSLPIAVRLNGHIPRLPGQTITALERAVELRNAIVHGRPANLDSDFLHSLLAHVNDSLYLFDLCAGQIWAWKCVSSEAHSLVGKPAAPAPSKAATREERRGGPQGRAKTRDQRATRSGERRQDRS